MRQADVAALERAAAALGTDGGGDSEAVIHVERGTRLQACAYCMAHEGNLKLRKCAQCRAVVYCSAECQKKHWKVHKQQCKRLGGGGED